MKKESKRKRLDILKTQLEMERSSFMTHYKDLGDYILPRRPRLTLSDTNKGDRRNLKIIDSTATLAVRTLRSGMMAGVTSPARPWFRLSSPDPAMAEVSSVKIWLHDCAERMHTTMLKSNLYQVLPIVYGDIGVFAISAVLVEEDLESVFRCYPFPIGSYLVSVNDKLKVDTFFREFRMTVRQVISKFAKRSASGEIDWSTFSSHVKQCYERGELETWVDVCHVIQPNEDYQPKKLSSKHKKFASSYYEKGNSSKGEYSGDANRDSMLSEKGYDYFPVLCPRWETTGEDSYGTDCPGMTALGDVKQLQLMEKRSAQAIEKKVNPAMVGPTSMKNSKASILPGDISWVDETNEKKFRPAHEVNLSIAELENKCDQVRGRIRKSFYEDLFLMLANDQRSNITAREIDERHEEKLLALGPVLEQLNQDLLDPLIDIIFDMMLRQRMILPPPEELNGMDLKVEYISVMAQAQKLAGVGNHDRFLGVIERMAQISPESLDKFNADQFIDVYGETLSVNPTVVRSDEEAASIREGRASAAKSQAQIEGMRNIAGTAKDLGNTPLETGSALDGLLASVNAGDLSGVSDV